MSVFYAGRAVCQVFEAHAVYGRLHKHFAVGFVIFLTFCTPDSMQRASDARNSELRDREERSFISEALGCIKKEDITRCTQLLQDRLAMIDERTKKREEDSSTVSTIHNETVSGSERAEPRMVSTEKEFWIDQVPILIQTDGFTFTLCRLEVTCASRKGWLRLSCKYQRHQLPQWCTHYNSTTLQLTCRLCTGAPSGARFCYHKAGTG